MKMRKILLGVTVFLLLGVLFKYDVKAEWVDPVGTARGYSSSFCYVVESNYNKGVNQDGTYDEAKSEGGGNRKLSDGHVWISTNYTSVIKITNPGGKNNPLTVVEAEDKSVVEVSRKTKGDIAQTYNEYSVKGLKYGTTKITVKRKNGNSFTIPVNVCKRVVLVSDEGKTEKEMAFGVGQTLIAKYIVKDGEDFDNNTKVYQWSCDNANVATVSDTGKIFAKAEGTATVVCRVYDSVACFNRYHYEDNYDGAVIRYKIRVTKLDPALDIYDQNDVELNHKTIKKNVGDVFKIRPTIRVSNANFVWLFTSSNEKVAVIDEVGTVSVIGEGTTNIDVSAMGQMQRFTIEASGQKEGPVIREIESIKVSIPENKMIVGSTLNLEPYIVTNPVNTRMYSISIASSDEGVIEIINHSNLVGKKAGRASLSVTVTDYKNRKFYANTMVYVTLKAPIVQCKSGAKSNTIYINKVDGAVSYSIYRSTKESDGYQKIATTKALSFIDTKIKSSKRYYYKVQANYKESACNSVLSSSVSSKLPVPKIKSIKKKGKAYVITIKGQQFTGFEVYYGKNKKTRKRIGNLKAKKSRVKLKLKKGKTYYFKVRAFEQTGKIITQSEFSKVFKLKIKKH